MPARRLPDEQQQRSRPTVALRLTRYGLPGAILLAGIVAAVVVPGETGLDVLVGLGGVCACVVLVNLLLRLGLSGERERDHEADARAYYDTHGRWPEERRRSR